MSAGSRSQVRTSWLPVSCSALNVWKNSSSVFALRCRNWTSSMSRTSVSRKRALNVVDVARLQRGDEVVREGLGGRAAHAQAAAVRGDVVADRVQEVGLAEAGRAVEKQRVVGLAGQLGDGERGRVGEAVGVADDELVERELRMKLALVAGGRRGPAARLGRRGGDRRVGRDDVDLRLRAEHRGGAGLQDAGEAIGDPAADLVGRGHDERAVDERARGQRREPDLEGRIRYGAAQLGPDRRPVTGELRGQARGHRLLRSGCCSDGRRAPRESPDGGEYTSARTASRGAAAGARDTARSSREKRRIGGRGAPCARIRRRADEAPFSP